MEQHENLIKILFLRSVMNDQSWDEEKICEVFYITKTYLHLLLRGNKPVSKKIFDKCVHFSPKSFDEFKANLDQLNFIPFMNQLENPNFKQMVGHIMFSIKLKPKNF